jgi:hypothetical protein
MNSKKRKSGLNLKPGGVLLAAGLLAGQRMAGAPVIMGPPPVDTTTPAAQEAAANNPMNVFVPAGYNNANAAEPFQYGPVIAHPHVSYSFGYGTGIASGNNNGQDTVIQQLSPGLTVDLGRQWTLDYTPTMVFYSSKQLQDGVNHAASLTGGASYEDWHFSLMQSFSSSDEPTTETATQTSQQNYSTALGANYVFSDKMSADFGLNQSFNFVENFQNSYNWSTMEWLNYAFAPRLNAGLGVGGGYTTVEDNNSGTGVNNPDSVNEMLQARVNWRATGKISFQISAGLEDQQYLASGYSDSLNPIFSASIQYQPFKVTQISLAASRTVGSSDYYIIAQSTEATTVSLSLNQRVLVKYNLNLGAGYTQTDYSVALAGFGGSNRTDDTYSFNASFGRNFLKRGNWAITYQYLDNSSGTAGFGQRSNQIGFQIGYRY